MMMTHDANANTQLYDYRAVAERLATHPNCECGEEAIEALRQAHSVRKALMDQILRDLASDWLGDEDSPERLIVRSYYVGLGGRMEDVS